MWRSVLLVALLMATAVRAQYADLSFAAQEARSASLGGCFLASGGAASALGNPASLPEGAFVVGSVESRYLASGFATRRLGFATPFGMGAAASAAYAYFGDAVYHEQHLGLGVGMRLSRTWRVGARLAYAYQGFADMRYRSSHRLGGMAAVWGEVGEALVLGGMVGVVPAERPLAAVALGAAYRASYGFALMADLVYCQRLALHVGVEYAWDEHLFARVGYESEGRTFAFGLGFRWRGLEADVAASSHPLLGFSPQISLCLWL